MRSWEISSGVLIEMAMGIREADSRAKWKPGHCTDGLNRRARTVVVSMARWLVISGFWLTD